MRVLTGGACALLLGLLAAVAGGDEVKGKKVEYAVHSGYFEKNNSGLKGESSYLALPSRKDFDKVFGVAVVLGRKQNFLPKGAFQTKLVAAVVKRGTSLWSYTVEKVTEDDGTLYVDYKATARGGGGSARFASPLILSVDRDKLRRVVFIENGKKAGTAEVGK